MSKKKTDIQVEESSGNVFADLGLAHPEECLVKADLAIQINQSNGQAQPYTNTSRLRE